jgi:translation elongation factor EF-Tu-like GTPase
MEGTLLEAFEISGRGCVALIDIESGTCGIGDRVAIGANIYEVTGVEMPHYDAEGRRRIAAGWKPPIGVLLQDARKSDLLGLIGQPVTGFSE